LALVESSVVEQRYRAVFEVQAGVSVTGGRGPVRCLAAERALLVASDAACALASTRGRDVVCSGRCWSGFAEDLTAERTEVVPLVRVLLDDRLDGRAGVQPVLHICPP
jgi:hypothetical protein